MRARNDTEALLALWETALGQPAEARAEALLRASPDGGEPAPTLGERNVRLIDLHARLFGREIELLSHCPACQAVAQFSADCEALAAQMRPEPVATPPHRLEAYGHAIEFRLPGSADVAQAGAAGGEHDFTQRLLGRCVLACTHEGCSVAAAELPESVLDALSRHMEALDPGASVSFALNCPQCAARWQAPLDVGEMLWRKVRAAAERVLLDIDALACAYGWTEREVLRLSPLRRAAYLQMVTAGG
jgi:hypothetical protein